MLTNFFEAEQAAIDRDLCQASSIGAFDFAGIIFGMGLQAAQLQSA